MDSKKCIFLLLFLTLFFLQILNAQGEASSSQEQLEEEVINEKYNLVGKGMDSIEIEGKISNKFLYKNSELEINGALFKDIVPGSYIIVGGQEIEKVDLKINENGGNYNINGNEFYAPPYSHVRFNIKTGILEIQGDKLEFTKLPQITDSGKYQFKISGKNIKISDEITLVEGETVLTEKGILLKDGVANYNQVFVQCNNEHQEVLFAKENVDMGDYPGNWIRQTEKKLEMQSGVSGLIIAEISENNKILNTDKRDYLRLEVEGGDGLIFESRKEEGLTPNLIHKSSEIKDALSGTDIKNGNLMFNLGKHGEINFKGNDLISNDDLGNKKYQTVPFEIISNLNENKNKIRIDAYNQFIILSKENEKNIIFNNYGIPVSNKIEENSIQTVDDLRRLFPSMPFEGIKKKIAFSEQIPIEGDNEKNSLIQEYMLVEEDITPPIMCYQTYNFIKENPEILEMDTIKKIVFNEGSSTYFAPPSSGNTDGYLMFGREVVDPTGCNKKAFIVNSIREVKSPLDIFYHEFIHAKAKSVELQETKLEESLEEKIINGYPEYKKLIEEKNIIDKMNIEFFNREDVAKLVAEQKEEEYNKLMEEYINEEFPKRGIKIDPNKKTFFDYSFELLLSSKKIQPTELKEFLARDNDLFYDFLVKGINQAKIDFINNRENIEIINKILEENGYKNIFSKIDNEFLKVTELNAISYLKKKYNVQTDLELFKVTGTDSKTGLYNLALMDIQEDKYGFASDILGKESVEELKKSKRIDLSIKYLDEFTNLKELLNSKDLGEKQKGFDMLGSSDFYPFIEYFDRLSVNNLDQIIRMGTGFPYAYSFRIYGDGGLSSDYKEVPTTFMEQPKELKARWLKGGNKKIQERYKQLTQILFDVEIMKPDEYQYLLGSCERDDCLDKLCVEYKFLCCANHPNSPNCKS